MGIRQIAYCDACGDKTKRYNLVSKKGGDEMCGKCMAVLNIIINKLPMAVTSGWNAEDGFTSYEIE